MVFCASHRKGEGNKKKFANNGVQKSTIHLLGRGDQRLRSNNERAITEGLASFYMRPLHGTGGDPGLSHLRILLIFSIFMDKIVV